MQQRGYATVLTNHSKQTDFPHHWVHCSSFLFFPHNYEYFLIWIFLFFTLLWYRYGIYMGQITQMEYENKQLQWQRILINNAELILNVEKCDTFSDFLKVGISFSGRSKGQVTNSLQRALIPTVPKKIPLRFLVNVCLIAPHNCCRFAVHPLHESPIPKHLKGALFL